MITADLLWQTARQHMVSGRFEAAREASRFGLQLDPDHARLRELLGLAEFELEEYGSAVHALETASSCVPLAVEAQLALADCYLRFGLVIAARAIYEFLAEPERCPIRSLPAVARGLGRLGLNAEALGICRRIVELDPGYHPAWYGVGHYLAMTHRPTGETISAFETAVRLAPEIVPYRLRLAGFYLDADRRTEACALVVEVPCEMLCCPCLCQKLGLALHAEGCIDLGDQWLAHAGRLASRHAVSNREVF